MGKQLVNFITWGCESSAPFLLFTKPGANQRRISDKLVWVVRSNDLTHWATRAQSVMAYEIHSLFEYIISIKLSEWVIVFDAKWAMLSYMMARTSYIQCNEVEFAGPLKC